jgi:hypothetical protein
MKLVPNTPAATLLNASLLFGPVAYLFLDSTYAARGWWDPQTGALHIVIAAVYGITAIRLVTLTDGRLQAALLVVALLGVVGNAGVGEDALHVGLGGNDLFRESGPANLFKVMGFFFPLTFLLTAIGLRGRAPAWNSALIAVGAVLFPVAHVQNISWLAILDGIILVLALGNLYILRDDLDSPTGDVADQSAASDAS